MDSISVRYGANLTLPIDTGDTTIVSADIFIGKPGETYTKTLHTEVVDAEGSFVFEREDTRIPLGEYKYQINTTDENGYVNKFPSVDDGCYDCEDQFPSFIVKEALDEEEVV